MNTAPICAWCEKTLNEGIGFVQYFVDVERGYVEVRCLKCDHYSKVTHGGSEKVPDETSWLVAAIGVERHEEKGREWECDGCGTNGYGKGETFKPVQKGKA